ncbi:porin [Methyloferula stellata]|uniref:porin n=1 Tax=Methyloferula stellata TaxID=876270 RepID=UPI000380C286|nr:porin [Methyloferula stellata]
MKLIKSLLLGSTASFSAVTCVYAADLPVRKAAPIEYVRICDAYGAGFFYIPGTDTCLKVGGLAYGEVRSLTNNYSIGTSNAGGTGYANGVARTAAGYTGGSFTNAKARDTTGFSALGRVELDARTQSGYGTVRTFIRIDAFYGSGANASTGSNFAIPNTYGNGQATQGSRETTIVNKAFIQFAGLTAGRAQSVFDFYADAYNYASLRGSNATVELLSYTYTFGGGFSSTLSVEDNNSRRTAIGSTVAGIPAGTLVGATLVTAAGTSFQGNPQGNRLPEIVGNVRYDAPWGAVQVSGAIHQIDAALYPLSTTALTSPATTGNFAALSTNEIGGAVQLGIMYNADIISPGDKAWVQAAYESGAYAYIAGNNLASSYGPVNGNRYAGDAFTPMDNSVFWNTNPGYDCVFTSSGQCDRQWGWDVTAAYKHYWMPTLSSAIYGSHLETFYSNAAYAGTSGFGSTTNSVGVVAPKETRIGTNLVWTPIKGFDIGVEGMWIHLTQNTPAGLATNATLATTGLPSFKNTQDEGEFRARVQRAF